MESSKIKEVNDIHRSILNNYSIFTTGNTPGRKRVVWYNEKQHPPKNLNAIEHLSKSILLRLLCRFEEIIHNYTDKQQPRNNIDSRPTIKEEMKGLLWEKTKLKSTYCHMSLSSSSTDLKVLKSCTMWHPHNLNLTDVPVGIDQIIYKIIIEAHKLNKKNNDHRTLYCLVDKDIMTPLQDITIFTSFLLMKKNLIIPSLSSCT